MRAAMRPEPRAGTAPPPATPEEAERRRQVAAGWVRACGFGARHGSPDRLLSLRPWCSRAQSAIDHHIVPAVAGGSMVVITGPRGRGKTQVAAHVVHRWYARYGRTDSRRARYEVALGLMLRIKATYGDHDRRDSPAHPIASAIGAALLVVDEAHELASDHDRQQLTYIVDQRYLSRRPTVLIANAASDRVSLECVLGASILERARDGGVIVDCSPWADQRGRP
jgi:hypothetical protein